MRNSKRLTAFVLAFLIVLTSFGTAAFAETPNISDVSGHWAEDTIQSWVDDGLIKGYPDGTFKPDQSITRAEFITLVNRAFGYTKTATISFTDVDQNAWYASAVAVAVETGYITGYPDGTMRPDNPISREEAATIIMKINKLVANPSAADAFTDSASLIWSNGAVGAVFAAGIMIGYPDGSFGPQKLIERGEATVALDRAMKYMAGPVTPPAPSVTRNDDTNTVSGMTTAMEYKLDSADYVTYVASAFDDLDFSGNHTLMVRFAALGINPFGPATTLTFTTNASTGGDGGGSHDIDVTAITVTPTAMTLTVGVTGTALAVFSPTNATNKSVTWSSDDEAVATVADGVVTPLTTGTAIITVTTVDGGFTTPCYVTVIAAATSPSALATSPSAIALTTASANSVTVNTDVSIPSAGATDTTGALTGWVTGTADHVVFTVTDAVGTASTITINGVAYESGEDYTIAKAPTTLIIVVITTETDCNTAVRTFTVSVE